MTDHSTRIPVSNLITTRQLLKQSRSIFLSNRYPLLFLSLLLFTFRTAVEDGTNNLNSFIDRDPALKSLLSRIDFSGQHQQRMYHISQNPNNNNNNRRRRRRPFLHLTRVGTLDEDFFSSEDDRDRASSGIRGQVVQTNDSAVIFSNFDPEIGFSPFVSDNGLILPEIIRPGVQFKLENRKSVHDGLRSEVYEDNNGDGDGVVDLHFLIKGLDIGGRDAVALFFLVSVLSAVYGWIILGFTAVYSFALGIVFVVVVNDLLGRHNSFFGISLEGSRLGFKRLSGFILMRWAVTDALTQLLGLWYFGEIEDQYSFFKLFVRLKLMPFSIMFPWIPGFEKEISGFLFTWFLTDTFVALIFAVDAWVTMVDLRRTGREIVKEGFYLIATLINQAVLLKCFEVILCGPAPRWLLTRTFGRLFATGFQAVAEAYFMVAWLLFYFAARSKEAHFEGRQFGRRELEQMADGLR